MFTELTDAQICEVSGGDGTGGGGHGASAAASCANVGAVGAAAGAVGGTVGAVAGALGAMGASAADNGSCAAVAGAIGAAAVAGGVAAVSGPGASAAFGGDTGGVSSGGGGGGGGGGKAICTHFYRKGLLNETIYNADVAYAYAHLSPITLRGYQFFAIPYVRLMRRSRLAEAAMLPLARAWAHELAHREGVRITGDLVGKLLYWFGVPLFSLAGRFVGEQNRSVLWSNDLAKAL